MLFADLILKNGKVITIDKNETIVKAVAVKFGKIVAVGSNTEIERFVGEQTEIIDLSGKTVIPGIIDSHGHFMREGSNRLMYTDLSEEAGIKSIADIQRVLKEKAANTLIGEWIFGYQEDDSKLAEKRHPTRWELDEISIEHPIMITTVGGHFEIANSYAFEQAGVTKNTPDPVGGKFDRNDKGELTGGIHEEAYAVLRPEGYPEPTRDQAYFGAKSILEEEASVGLTCVYDLVARSSIRAAIDLKNANKLPIRVRMDITIDLLDELNKLGI